MPDCELVQSAPQVVRDAIALRRNARLLRDELQRVRAAVLAERQITCLLSEEVTARFTRFTAGVLRPTFRSSTGSTRGTFPRAGARVRASGPGREEQLPDREPFEISRAELDGFVRIGLRGDLDYRATLEHADALRAMADLRTRVVLDLGYLPTSTPPDFAS